MADLLDIVTATAADVVRIDGERIVVRGLNAKAIALIAARFPNVRKVLRGGGDDYVALLFELAGEAIGPIIAAGYGRLGNEKYERHAATMLNLEDQTDLVTAIVRLTFPNGLTAFLAKLSRLSEGASEKTIKVRLKKSPSTLQPLSDADSRPSMQ
jgi:hypothetical protein